MTAQTPPSLKQRERENRRRERAGWKRESEIESRMRGERGESRMRGERERGMKKRVR